MVPAEPMKDTLVVLAAELHLGRRAVHEAKDAVRANQKAAEPALGVALVRGLDRDCQEGQADPRKF